MIDPNDRDALEDAMTRYVLGELEDADARELARLVAERPEIAAEVDALRRAFGTMAYDAVATPPPHLRARVLAAAAAATSTRPTTTSGRACRR